MTRGADVDPLAFLRSVRQVRELRPEPAPAAALTAILEVARWSGSGMNRQPWEFLVIEDRATLDELASKAPSARHLANAGAAILLLMAGANAEILTYDEG